MTETLDSASEGCDSNPFRVSKLRSLLVGVKVVG